MVLLPTPPNVKPLISLSGRKAYPAYSILTYLKIPLLSAGFCSWLMGVPYSPNPSLLLTPPSISPIPDTPLNEALVGALPNSTTPDQSPRLGVAASEVKIIGLSAVP